MIDRYHTGAPRDTLLQGGCTLLYLTWYLVPVAGQKCPVPTLKYCTVLIKQLDVRALKNITSAMTEDDLPPCFWLVITRSSYLHTLPSAISQCTISLSRRDTEKDSLLRCIVDSHTSPQSHYCSLCIKKKGCSGAESPQAFQWHHLGKIKYHY